ncbi:kinase-like protein [Penicillium riverlandense]|uniref:kinase-like protein n=1 Tax=Penicillium riverlandense TaxID=1903569 RepID=UPI0025486EFF|nr:kinase-like protein [Penicillium riverlandense]KAJ5812103.1 kinase-like protein [Penicillium riverlandense]
MLFNASPSSWIMSWILALQFLISLSLPFTHAAPVSDLVQLSGSVGHETAPLPAASDEYEKYLSKRSPGVTGNAWFIRTRRNGDKVFGFGQDVGSKYLPARQLGSVTVKNRPLGSGSFGTVSEGILFEFDRSRPREKDLEDEPCGYERSNVVVKRGKAKDSYFGGAVQHRLEPGGYVPIVYKDLWIPAGRDYPEGESLVVMERMGKDAFAILSQFPTAFARKEPWALSFSRLYMIKDLVDGLEYAHSNRIIDMDVKLENLMQRIPTARSRSQRFAIIDWDFAIDLSRAQSSWPRKGTPLYAAPGKTKNPNCCR